MNVNILVEKNLHIVPPMARRYASSMLPYEDLQQEGNIGLIKAAHKFDPGRGIKFITHALWWVRAEILRALEDKSRMIRIPQWVQEEIASLKRKNTSLEEDFISDDFIDPENFNLFKKVTGYMKQQEDFSIGGEKDLEDSLTDEGNLFETAYNKILREKILRAFDGLLFREKIVLRHRYDLWEESFLTFRELGRELGVSFQRAKQIEEEAFVKLRRMLSI